MWDADKTEYLSWLNENKQLKDFSHTELIIGSGAKCESL